MKKKFLNILSLGLLFGVLGYAFWDIDIQKMMVIINDIDLYSLVVSMIFVLFTCTVPAARLQIIVGEKVDFKDSYNSTLFGYGWNNLLPAKMGELAKILYLNNCTALTVSETTAAVFWERFCDLVAVLLLAALAILFSDIQLAFLPLLCVVFSLVFVLFLNKARPAIINTLIEVVPIKGLQKFLVAIATDLRQERSWIYYAKLYFFTGVGWLSFSAFFYFGLVILVGIDIPVSAIFTVLVVSSLGMAIPSTPGSIGVYEAAIVLALGWYDIPIEEAIVAAIFLHISQIIPTTLYALYLFYYHGQGFRETIRGVFHDTKESLNASP